MADPLSISASVIAIIQLSGKVIQYLRDIKESSPHKHRILLELSGTRGVLETLNDVDNGVKDDGQLFRNVKALEEPIKNYEALLKRLETALEPSQGLKKLGRAFKWPFDKAEVQEILTALERYKSLFGLALHADHLEISKAVKEDLAELRASQKNEETREILTWLSPLDFAAQQRRIFSKHEEGTAQWLLDDAKFSQWKTGQSRYLWCPGVPGAGKTVFSSIVLDHLANSFNQSEAAVLGIYCDYKEFNQQSTAKYLASLLQQLIIQRGSLPAHIKTMYETNSKKHIAPTFPELLDLLQREMLEFSRAYIVIDALDECTELNGIRDQLLEGVLQLPESTSVLITSRYIPGIDIYLQDALRLDVKAHEDDLQLFVRNRLAKEKTWARRVRLDASLQIKTANSIVERAGGMFLLAQLHLSSIVRKHSRKAIEEAVKELPAGLTSAYDQILQRIDDQGEDDAALAREVLSWLTLSPQPLTASVLQQALAIKPQDASFEEDALIHEETILAVCVGMVVIDQESGVIRFVHYTTQEYFHQARKVEFVKSSLRIATTCLTFLLFAEDTKEELSELYTYVADNWGHHARESPETTELVSKIVNFLSDTTRLEKCVDHMSTHMLVSKSMPPLHSLHIAAKFDLAMTMERLLELDSSSINAPDIEGRTPLYYAAATGEGLVVSLLLRRSDLNIDFPSYYQGSPLHRAIEARQASVAIMLLERGANTELKDAKGIRPIHKAIEFDLPGVLEALLKKKVDVVATTNSGHRPIEMASSKDSQTREKTKTGLWRGREITAEPSRYIPILRMLLDHLTKADIDRGQMIMDVTIDGRPDIVQFMLDKGATPSFKSVPFNQRTPLHWAAEKGFQKCAEILVSRGCDVDSQDAQGLTPAHRAASAGREDMVKFLIPKMEDLNIKANNGMTPLQSAEAQGHQHIRDILHLAGADDTPAPIPQQSAPGDFPPEPGLRRRTDTGTSISEEDYRRYTERFLLAAANGDMEGVLLCLAKGVSVRERDHQHNKIALHWAAENGHEDITNLLLERGSPLSSQDLYGETPLHYAAESGHNAIVAALVRQGPQRLELAKLDDRGRTPLRCARDNYHRETIRLLLGGGRWEGTVSDLEEKDSQEKSLLHWAAEVADEEMCGSLLDLKPSEEASAPDARGWTPLRYAQGRGSRELEHLFGANGPDTKAKL